MFPAANCKPRDRVNKSRYCVSPPYSSEMPFLKQRGGAIAWRGVLVYYCRADIDFLCALALFFFGSESVRYSSVRSWVVILVLTTDEFAAVVIPCFQPHCL
jgi:hypothetical protein